MAMTITIKGLTESTYSDLSDYMMELDKHGYGFDMAYEQVGSLYNVEFYMNNMAIVPVLDGIELRPSTSHVYDYYIDAEDFVEIVIG